MDFMLEEFYPLAVLAAENRMMQNTKKNKKLILIKIIRESFIQKVQPPPITQDIFKGRTTQKNVPSVVQSIDAGIVW